MKENQNLNNYCYFCLININTNSGIKHCYQCKKCIKDQDHHCLWVNNCISQRNHSTFIIFLLCLMLYSLVTLLILITQLINKPETRTQIRNILFIFIYLLTIAVCLVQFKNSIKYKQNIEKKKQTASKSKLKSLL